MIDSEPLTGSRMEFALVPTETIRGLAAPPTHDTRVREKNVAAFQSG